MSKAGDGGKIVRTQLRLRWIALADIAIQKGELASAMKCYERAEGLLNPVTVTPKAPEKNKQSAPPELERVQRLLRQHEGGTNGSTTAGAAYGKAAADEDDLDG